MAATGNPFFDAWMDAGRRFFEEGGTTAWPGTPSGLTDLTARAEENWRLCQRQAEDWVKASSRWLSAGRAAGGGTPEETLRRMLDPSRFLFAGTDEINQAIQRLVEGPEFADIGTLERQVLKATREWFALREASAAYRAVTAGAWSRAFASFTREMATSPEALAQGSRPVLDRWLAIANEELIRTQRTDEFLKAQRELLAAGVAYRLKERELVEVWCETHSIPTRTEVDDVHRTVHELRGQIRALRAEVAAARRAAPDIEAGPTTEPEPATKAPRRRTSRTPA